MATSTVIRVKRRLEDDPVEALVLSYKRKKGNEGDDKEKNSVWTFAGTVNQKDDNVVSTAVNKSKTKADLTENYKSHLVDVPGRQRVEHLTRSKESRFRVLSLNRTISATEEASGDGKTLTIVDVDTEIDPADINEPEELVDTNSVQYVYDIYYNDYLHCDDFNDGYMESLISVQPLHSIMEYRASEDVDEVDPYDEDSNDEGHWRNDYPDSDHSINDDDMRLAANLKGMGIDDGADLSSDSEDNEYLAMSGLTSSRAYDSYKARVLAELNDDPSKIFVQDSDDGDSDDNNEFDGSEYIYNRAID